MNKKEFIKWEKEVKDSIDFKTIYVDIAGDLVAGLLLSQIIYWNLPDKKGRKTKLQAWKKGDERNEASYWLAKRYADWYSECRVKPKRAERAIKRLVERGIIETRIYKFKGSPTTHIRIVWDSFFEQLENAIQLREAVESHSEDKENTEVLVDLVNSTEESSQNDGVLSHNGQIQLDKTGDSLTETTTENTKENKSKIKDSLSNQLKKFVLIMRSVY